MGEEQRQILEMLDQGKIDIDEAQRLLEALKEGEKKRFESHKSKEDRKNLHSILSNFNENMENLGPAISEGISHIGSVIGDALNNAFSNINMDYDIDFENLAPVTLEENKFSIEQDSHIFILNKPRKSHLSSSDLDLFYTEENDCKLEYDQDTDVSVYKKENNFYILWNTGNLKVFIPGAASKVKSKTLNGNIIVQKIKANIKAKTMNGDILLNGISGEFKASTMRGDVKINLNPDWNGDSKVNTMHGAINLNCSAKINANIECVTLNGNIDFDEQIGVMESKKMTPIQKKVLKLGSGEKSSNIKLKTMNGNIEIRETTDE